jgi:hypothetical protein
MAEAIQTKQDSIKTMLKAALEKERQNIRDNTNLARDMLQGLVRARDLYNQSADTSLHRLYAFIESEPERLRQVDVVDAESDKSFELNSARLQDLEKKGVKVKPAKPIKPRIDWAGMENIKLKSTLSDGVLGFKEWADIIGAHDKKNAKAGVALGDPRRKLLNFLHGHNQITYRPILGELSFSNEEESGITKAAYNFIKEKKKCLGLKTTNTTTNTDVPKDILLPCG